MRVAGAGTPPVVTRPSAGGLLAAAHPGPAVAVATVAALLAVDAGLPAGTAVVVTGAVLTGHLTLGWANDLLDLPRDRAVGRADKPLTTGRTSTRAVATALAVAALACVVLSVALGWRSGLVHLVLGIGSGQAYNLGLKRTALSWLPYAVTFGTLPAVVGLAADVPAWPPWWLVAAGAALGVGAHVVNALPDLADDLRTGVRGLPHRVGEPVARPLAAALLVAASLLAAFGPAGVPAAWVWPVLLVVVALAAVALAGRGRTPFRAALAIALLDVVLLVAAG
ncbi:UbiA family prenyltransferase [Actinomycetospora straminea]|uniref:UbiA family prenyltransferase n=1 Tax=Actinomycetospora straminea TaxID=663607 RepID=A0ABP9F501_9PSEU|nr:UbiA family prenyltransferase [Actinomycetospora straminea]MDD7936189.1 UbiA family prenyltransferase [Actinomycetospora straminea]